MHTRAHTQARLTWRRVEERVPERGHEREMLRERGVPDEGRVPRYTRSYFRLSADRRADTIASELLGWGTLGQHYGISAAQGWCFEESDLLDAWLLVLIIP